jgi:hypothetical protein
VRRDLTGEALRACHANGIRYIARFDFSKAHRSIYEKHPDWFYRSPRGKIVDYNEMIHTCVNGFYQRECSLKIIEEVLARYDVDGVFFNMFGYQTRDYSGNYYGICHCESCTAEFRRMYSSDLPSEEEDPNEAICAKYGEFKEITVRRMLERIHDLVKARRPDVAISTYATHMVDIVKNESNTEIGRPLPDWIYSASENVQSVGDTWSDKVVSNVCINAVGIRHRFVGVSKEAVATRLYQSIAAGSGLDFCIIGSFENYPDRQNIDIVRRIYRFHSDHEELFGDLRSVAEVALFKPGGAHHGFPSKDQQDEFRGLFRMLKEEHVLFDVIHLDGLAEAAHGLDRYRLLIFPDIRNWEAEDLRILREVLESGGSTRPCHLLATALSFSTAEARSLLDQHFGVVFTGTTVPAESCYFQTDDQAGFTSFDRRRWIAMDGTLAGMRSTGGAVPVLPLISAGRYGPPERVGANEPTGDHGCFLRAADGRRSWILPWHPGALYQHSGYDDPKRVIMDLIGTLNLDNSGVWTDAPPCVEFFYAGVGPVEGRSPGFLLQLINHSGFDGYTFHPPVEIHGTTVRIHDHGIPFSGARSLTGSGLRWERGSDQLIVTIAKLNRYEAILLETQPGGSQ